MVTARPSKRTRLPDAGQKFASNSDPKDLSKLDALLTNEKIFDVGSVTVALKKYVPATAI